MEDLTQLLDEGSPVDIVYLDFKKAFDSVPHKRLLTKLNAYDISGKVLKWIESFLSNRTQTVRVGNSKSGEASVLSGIPQGSILGPDLFTIFINDLPDCVLSHCKIFADDTKLHSSTANSELLKQDLMNLQVWTEKWQLYFNVDKCSIMHLGNSNTQRQYLMHSNGIDIPLKVITEEKDLGVTFDPNLKFDKHIHKAVNKANQMLGLIKRSFRNMCKDTFTKLYKAFVRPHLEYGSIIWNPLLKRQSIEVEKVQRRASRLLKECKDMKYKGRLTYLKLHSLKGRRIRGDIIETYKIFHKTVNLDWTYFFSSPNSTSTRNSDGKIFIKSSRTNIRKNCFSNRVAFYWNSLPTNIKNANDINSFKSLLDESPKFKDLFHSFDE